MAEYTPGPWEWSTDGSVLAAAGPNQTLVLVLGLAQQHDPTPADAAIIAITPDLLAVAWSLVSLEERATAASLKDWQVIAELTGIIDAARVAIAKARGEKQR